MSASRQELLQWVNDLLQTNYTKIESLGSGAAYCQILDSIYHDTPMNRVKFNASTPYDYMNNLKILQNLFVKHRIEKPLNTQKLMELKFQNNFELLQFLKAYWDTHYQGGHYDAEARRKGMQLETRSQPSPRPLSSSSSVRSAPRTTNRTGGISRTTPTSASTNRAAKAPVSRPGPGSAGGANSTANTAALADAHRQIEELKSLLGTSEQERAYYYNKLLSVESILNLEEKSENTEIKALVQRLQDAIYNDGEADMMTGQDSELVNGSEMDTSGYNGTYHGLEQVKEEDEGQEEETF